MKRIEERVRCHEYWIRLLKTKYFGFYGFRVEFLYAKLFFSLIEICRGQWRMWIFLIGWTIKMVIKGEHALLHFNVTRVWWDRVRNTHWMKSPWHRTTVAWILLHPYSCYFKLRGTKLTHLIFCWIFFPCNFCINVRK